MSKHESTVAIGNGSIVLALPNWLSFEVEKDGTICTFLTEMPNLLALRFTSLTVEAKAPQETSKIDLAPEVLSAGKQKGLKSVLAEGKAWYYEDQDSQENGQQIWLRFWHVGYRNNRIIISLCCDSQSRQNTQVQKTMAVVPQLIAGLNTRNEKSPLTSQEHELLDRQREVVENLLRAKYNTYALPKLKSDLPLLQQLINDHVFSPEQKYEWSCIGVAFGDVVANELGLNWIAQCDEYGTEPALNLENTSITLFPRTMILKRVEKSEYPDLQFLLGKLKESIDDLRRKGC